MHVKTCLAVVKERRKVERREKGIMYFIWVIVGCKALVPAGRAVCHSFFCFGRVWNYENFGFTRCRKADGLRERGIWCWFRERYSIVVVMTAGIVVVRGPKGVEELSECTSLSNYDHYTHAGIVW